MFGNRTGDRSGDGVHPPGDGQLEHGRGPTLAEIESPQASCVEAGDDGLINVRPLPARPGESLDGAIDEAPHAWFSVPAAVPAIRSTPRQAQRLGLVEATLPSLGLPDFLSPPSGGLYALISQLESLPKSHVPALRPGDEVLVVTLWPGARGDDEVAQLVGAELCEAGRRIDRAALRVEPWSVGPDEGGSARAAAARSAALLSERPRLVLLHTTPDYDPTTAYRVCRSLPGVQLDLWGVQDAARPAAALAWGCPVAFVDGRPATSELWAAICVNRLAGSGV